MIIAFYPGAGGNRYLRWLLNKEWTTSGISYDNLVIDQPYKNRYLIDSDEYADNNIILTHCLNSAHILNKFSEHKIVFILGDIKKCLQREWRLAGHERYVNRNIKSDINRLEHYNAIKDESWPECHNLDDINHLPPNILNEVLENLKKVQKVYEPDCGSLVKLENSIQTKLHSAYEMIQWHKDYYSKYPLSYTKDVTIIDINNDADDFSKFMRVELELYNSEIFNEVWNEIYT